MMGDTDNTADMGMQALGSLDIAADARIGDGTLGGANLASMDADTTNDILTTEWDIGGNVKGAGVWTAATWGADDEAAADNDYPLAVTGEFNASLGTVGSIVGGFGATQE